MCSATTVVPAIQGSFIMKEVGNNFNIKKALSKTENDYEKFNIRSNSESSNLTEEMLTSIFIDKCYQNYQDIYYYNKNISKKEFTLKFGTTLKSMFYLYRSEYRNLTKFSSGNQFYKLNQNHSRDYQLFNHTWGNYTKFRSWWPTNNNMNWTEWYHLWNDINIPAVWQNSIGPTIVAFIFGLIFTRSIMGSFLLAFSIFGLYVFIPHAYFWRVCMYAAEVTAHSVSLAVCCQYKKNNQTIPITNATITAHNQEDKLNTFGNFTLYYNNDGWYYTLPQTSTDMVPPPGYWDITIHCEDFVNKTIHTNEIHTSDIFTNVTYLTPDK